MADNRRTKIWRSEDGRAGALGRAAEIAWIEEGTETGLTITSASLRYSSAPELARKLRIRENLVNYHLAVLFDSDCIELAVTRKRGGKDIRFFRVKPGVAFPTVSLSPLFKGEAVSKDTLHAFGRKVSSALEGGEEEGSGATIALETFSLTEPDQFVAHEALRLTVANLRLLAEQSRQVSIATDAPLTSIELGIAMIPASPPDTEESVE